MAEDAEGWSAAEQAEIDNHNSHGSWTLIDRSELPQGRSLGCAQTPGVDYDQTFCATMRPTSLRALASIAAANGMLMRRWTLLRRISRASCKKARWCTATLRRGTPASVATGAYACAAWRNLSTAWPRRAPLAAH
eukprot:4959976-Pleurochrysis_carterae.AAC.2